MGRIVLFGATGYTGRLVAEELVAAGERPVLAGRDPERLDVVAAALGTELETVQADVLRQNSVFALVEPGDVLISTVGPFVKHGEPAIRAAIEAGATYLDSTGEPVFIRRVFEEFGSAGAALLTAMGFDYVPGALAGALAIEEAGADEVARVDVAYYVLGATASAGTKESLVGAMLDPGFAWRDGRLVTERGGMRARAFSVDGRPRNALSVGGAEHFTLPAAYPGLREVNSYIGLGPLTRAAQAGSVVMSGLQRLPGARSVLLRSGERLVGLTPSRTPGSEADARSIVVGEAFDAAGRKRSEVQLAGADPYRFTGAFLAWAAMQPVEGQGALSPLTAFGLRELERGVAHAGIERVVAPVA